MRSSWLFIISVIVFLTVFNCLAQSKLSAVLAKKTSQIDTSDISLLIRKGYINRDDGPLIGSYMVTQSQKNKQFYRLTIAQMLIAYKAQNQQVNHQIALKNNFGKDSVFIHTPGGSKFFLGMGQMSFNDLVKRESRNLPTRYTENYEIRFDKPGAMSKFTDIITKNKQGWIIGNVILAAKECKQLNRLRLGDVILIAKRIALSKEFTPFVHAMD